MSLGFFPDIPGVMVLVQFITSAHHSNCLIPETFRIHVIVFVVPLRDFPTRCPPHAIVGTNIIKAFSRYLIRYGMPITKDAAEDKALCRLLHFSIKVSK
jgi:hypothetical protein